MRMQLSRHIVSHYRILYQNLNPKMHSISSYSRIELYKICAVSERFMTHTRLTLMRACYHQLTLKVKGHGEAKKRVTQQY